MQEFTNVKGEIINTNNNWIVAIDHEGKIKRYDWTNIYNKVRKAADCETPGYLVHEAVLWSEAQKKWMFLPRRVSKEVRELIRHEEMPHRSNASFARRTPPLLTLSLRSTAADV